MGSDGENPIKITKSTDGQVHLENFTWWRIVPMTEGSKWLFSPGNRYREGLRATAEQWENLRQAAAEGLIQEWWPRFSRHAPPPRETLPYFVVHFDFGQAKSPWAIKREDWEELKKLLERKTNEQSKC